MASYASIINLRYAKGGTDGSVEIVGATRARIEMNFIKRTQRPAGAVAPANVVTIGGTPQVFIESESRESEILAYKQTELDKVQIIVLGYTDTTGIRKRTIKFCKLTGIRSSQFPPVESGGPPPRFELIYDVVTNFDASADTLDEMFVDSTDT